MDVNTQPRRPQGAPGAGQWDHLAGSESQIGLSLAAGELAAEKDLLAQCSQQVTIAYRALAPTLAARSMAKARQEGQSSIDDDLVQETAVRVLQSKGRVEVQVADGAYVYGIARNLVRESIRGDQRRADIRARAKLDADAQQLESQLGRMLTGGERNMLAKKIRDGWDNSDSHGIPSVGFHLPTGMLGLNDTDATTLSAEDGYLKADEQAQASSHHFHLAEASSELAGRKGHASARALAWNMMAERDGSPTARRSSMSKGAVTAARTHVTTHSGGVRGVIEAWERGEDNHATESLFAPFGPLNEAGRRAVVDTLTSSSYCEDLWDSAVIFASNRFQFDEALQEVHS